MGRKWLEFCAAKYLGRWNAKIAADFTGEKLIDLVMARNR
jgi:hypothetical protein